MGSMRKKQVRESVVERFLVSLDNIWSKLIVIGMIAIAGFKFGCYYQETQSLRAQQLHDKELWDKWAIKEESFKKQIDGLMRERIELKTENSDLKLQIKFSHETR